MSEILRDGEKIDPFLKHNHSTSGNPNDSRHRTVTYQAEFWPLGPQSAFCESWGTEEIYAHRSRIEIHITLKYPGHMREQQIKALDQLTLAT